MGLCKGSLSQLQVIGLDHEGLKVYNVLNIIGKEGFKGPAIPVPGIVVPEQDGKISVHPVKPSAVKAKGPFTPLQAAAEPETLEYIAKIDMNLVQANAKFMLDKGQIKTLAIVGYNGLVPGDIPGEKIQVLAFYIVEDGGAVVQGNCRDGLTPGFKARGLNVKRDHGISKFGKKAPVKGRRKPLCKISVVARLHLLSGLIHMAGQGFDAPGGKTEPG